MEYTRIKDRVPYKNIIIFQVQELGSLGKVLDKKYFISKVYDKWEEKYQISETKMYLDCKPARLDKLKKLLIPANMLRIKTLSRVKATNKGYGVTFDTANLMYSNKLLR